LAQNKASEVTRLRAEKEAEAKRIACIIQDERNAITNIEQRFKALGAYCTDEIELESTPLSICVITPDSSNLNKQYVGKVLVADTNGVISLYSPLNKTKLASYGKAGVENAQFINPSALVCAK